MHVLSGVDSRSRERDDWVKMRHRWNARNEVVTYRPDNE
jgi:hypothetical protein